MHGLLYFNPCILICWFILDSKVSLWSNYLHYNTLKCRFYQSADFIAEAVACSHRIVASRSTSWLVTPHVTNWIWTQIVTWAPKNKSCVNELKVCEDSRNSKSIRCSKFQLSSLKNKNVLFLKKMSGMLVIETLKRKISDFLISNMCFCSRLYGMLFGNATLLLYGFPS